MKNLITLFIFTLFVSFVYSTTYQYARCNLEEHPGKLISGDVFFAYGIDNKLHVAIKADGDDYLGKERTVIIHNNGNLVRQLDETSIFNPTKSTEIDCLNVAGYIGTFKSESSISTPELVLDNQTIQGVDSLVGLTLVVYSNAPKSCPLTHYSDLGDILGKCVIGIGSFDYPLPEVIVTAMTGDSKKIPTKSDSNGAMKGLSNVNGNQAAICTLEPTSKFFGELTGTVYITSKFDEKSKAMTTSITAEINGLVPQSIHGFHIHSLGDISSGDGMSVGGHWDSSGQVHSLPPNPNRHYGDLGNICQYVVSTAYYSWTTTYLPYTSTNNLLGRSFVVHAIRDNGTVFGDRVGWCVVGLLSPTDNPPFKLPPSIQNNNVICSNSPPENQFTTPTPPPSNFFKNAFYIIITLSILVYLYKKTVR
ncbi:superoxide dismutase [Tieghemostelium lacteum]|uniref:Superoxide dismutase n=1 Tax=Tieghemostelium lacteum TaxID=361077 RepID=A0A151Z773_TIELA|nr:superoxide dismutase [Tieghemostelium lacteum]|eukprot:KYQ89785.1 superoxide dismutase [Tieghemostelium lacteum]